MINSSDRLRANSQLAPGRRIYSSGREIALVLSPEGFLTLQAGDVVLWKPPVNEAATSLLVRGDGNLVLWRPGKVLWHTATTGHPNVQLVVQSDGNLVLYGPGGVLWKTDTVLPAKSAAKDTSRISRPRARGFPMVAKAVRWLKRRAA